MQKWHCLLEALHLKVTTTDIVYGLSFTVDFLLSVKTKRPLLFISKFILFAILLKSIKIFASQRLL
jgi:hypothetical protein